MKFILYHDKCSDGTMAAFSFWEAGNNTSVYIPVNYNPLGKLEPKECLEEILKTPIRKQMKDVAKDLSKYKVEDLSDYELYILDFSFPVETLKYFNEVFERVTLIDHHKSAQEDVKKGFDLVGRSDNGTEVYVISGSKSSSAVFNMDFSGAELAWMYINNKLDHHDPRTVMPVPVRLIGDRDLWKFEYPLTKDYVAGFHFSYFESFREIEESDIFKLVDLGKVYNRSKDIEIRRMVSSSRMDITVILEGNEYKGMLINNTDNSLTSDSADVVRSMGYDLLFSYAIRRNGTVSGSLRSSDKLDCSKVAAKFGGGGHKAASGLSMSLSDLTDLLDTRVLEV